VIEPTEVEQIWQRFHDDADWLRLSNSATLQFSSWFGDLDAPTRQAVLPVLSSWILSTNHPQQTDALAVVGDFRLSEVIPALEELSSRLRGTTSPVDRFLRVKVLRLLADLLEHREIDNTLLSERIND